MNADAATAASNIIVIVHWSRPHRIFPRGKHKPSATTNRKTRNRPTNSDRGTWSLLRLRDGAGVDREAF